MRHSTDLSAAHPPEPDGLERIMSEMPAYGSEFARTYANHAPMVLVALSRIGGSTQRLYDFFRAYRDAKELLPLGPMLGTVDQATWEASIGRREMEPAYRVFFAGEVARLGIDDALRTYLPHLAPGIGASALHALMRTAYGLVRRNETEIAISLAYWAAAYLEMPAPTGAPPVTQDPADILARVAAIPMMHELTLHELLWQNMRESGRTPDFAPVVDWLDIGPDTPRRMAAASIALFAATQDFCALHAVTGMHWVRVVMPYCPDATPMLRHFWQCIAALMGEMRFPVLPDTATLDRWRDLPAPGWDEIEAAAARSYDEHDISLTFSAREEMKVYGDPLYRLAAARRVGLVADYTAS